MLQVGSSKDKEQVRIIKFTFIDSKWNYFCNIDKVRRSEYKKPKKNQLSKPAAKKNIQTLMAWYRCCCLTQEWVNKKKIYKSFNPKLFME